MTVSEDEAAIAREATCCVSAFADLLRLQDTSRHDPSGGISLIDIPSDGLMDTWSRYKIWLKNIGALNRGKASLDHRLRHADLRVEVLRLLRHLQANLRALLEIASGSRIQHTWTSEEPSPPSDFSSDEDTDEDDDEGCKVEEYNMAQQPTTESEVLYQSVSEAITSLFKLSMFIQKSTRGNKFSRSSRERKYETQADIRYIQDKFPYASQNRKLCEQLGKANAQRRQWLLYNKRHRERLSKGLKPPSDLISGVVDPKWLADVPIHGEEQNFHDDAVSFAPAESVGRPDTILSSTAVSTFYEQPRRDFELDQASEAAVSQTSYFDSGLDESEHDLILVPEPPVQSKNETPFECPYCLNIITIRGAHSWKKHVHSDLASYVCTQENCSHALFESRHEWFDHELEVHRKRWVCDLCGNVSPSTEEYISHMRQRHQETFTRAQASEMASRAAHPVDRILAAACPLCDYEAILRRKPAFQITGVSSSEPIMIRPHQFRNHLGRHLEQIALFVLPRSELREQDDDQAPSIPEHGDEDIQSQSSGDSVEVKNLSTELDHRDVEVAELSQRLDGELISSMNLVNRAHLEFLVEEEELSEELGPGLALGWQPAIDFMPPDGDFNVNDPDLLPRREDSMFGGDLFTPGWVRGEGSSKEAFCGRCVPSTWHNMEDLSYEQCITYRHGIASSGIPLPRPSEIRRVSGRFEGFCDLCKSWRRLRRTHMGWNWFRHCVQEHIPASADKEIERDELAIAIRKVDLPTIDSLLNAHPHLVLQRTANARTPLHYAAEVGDDDSIQKLIEHFRKVYGLNEVQAFLNAKSAKGETPLMLSVSQGHFEIAKHLLLEGADPRSKSTDGMTALAIAKQTGHSSIERLLLSCTRDGKSPNSYFEGGPPELARTTSEGEVRIRVADTTNWTPLMHAAVHGNDIRVTTLINEGADTEASTQEGETALLLAAGQGHLEIARSLVNSGANIDAITAKGWTPLMVAVRNSHEEMVKLLLSCGADVNHLSSDGWTALVGATEQGFIPIMEMLLQCGADTETKSQHDFTPLMHAAHKGNLSAVKLLLEMGASWERCSRHDEDAMLLAAAVGSTSIVRTLLDAGCPTEAAWASSREQGTQSASHEVDEITKGPDQRAVDLGWTPLMIACQNGHEPVVRMLLEAGANVEPRSPLRKTAKEIAKENGRIEIFNILQDHSP